MKKISSQKLAKDLGIHPARSLEAQIKAKLISAIFMAVERKGITHQELAIRSGISRSSITGILSGSLQKVTLDRVLRLMEAADLTAEFRVKNAA